MEKINLSNKYQNALLNIIFDDKIHNDVLKQSLTFQDLCNHINQYFVCSEDQMTVLKRHYFQNYFLKYTPTI
jgi:hypothetical protein